MHLIDKKGKHQGLTYETFWGNHKTTEALIGTIKKTGLISIRIPVILENHLIDENYTVDHQWMKRVKEIIGWSIKQGIYVILNTHHDIYTKYNEPLIEKDIIH